jgi:zinc protease
LLLFRPEERRSLAISFSCAPDKVEALTGAVFQEIAAIQSHGTDRDHLDKIKASQRRERETDLKENDFWLEVLANYYRSGWDPRNILRFDELVEHMSLERLQAAAREYLPTGRYVIGVLKPEGPTHSAAGRPSPDAKLQRSVNSERSPRETVPIGHPGARSW